MTHARPGFSGLTLVGLLVVLAIGLAIYFAAGPSGKSYAETVRDTRDSGRELAQQTDDRQLVTMIVQYQLENDDDLPRGPEDLDIANLPGSRDEFGTLVRYEPRTEGRTAVLDIVSAGEDEQHGTDDDEVLRTVELSTAAGNVPIPTLPDGLVRP